MLYKLSKGLECGIGNINQPVNLSLKSRLDLDVLLLDPPIVLLNK